MAFMKTSNPVLNEKRFRSVRGQIVTGQEMTISGTVYKSLFLVALVFLGAFWAWNQAYPSGWGMTAHPQVPGISMLSMFGGMILAFVMIFKPKTSPYLAPVYALMEGAFLGGISVLVDYKYPGVAAQAIISTFGTFVAMLLTYQSGLIQVTDRFRMGVVAATGGIALVYFIDIILGFFGMHVPFINSGGGFGIVVSLIIVAVAALNLLLDFDLIVRSAKAGAPKFMEWYASFGLLMTLVWLYLEILRLLANSQRR